MKQGLAILVVVSAAQADFLCDPQAPVMDRFRASPLVVEGTEALPLRSRSVLAYGPDWLALGTATLGEIQVQSSFKGHTRSRLLISTPSWREDRPVVDCAPQAMADWTPGDRRILFLEGALGVPRTYPCSTSPLLSDPIEDLGPIESLFGSVVHEPGSDIPWRAAGSAGELLGSLGRRRLPSRSAPSTPRFIWRSDTEVLVDLRSASILLERQSPSPTRLSHQERAARLLRELFPDLQIVQLRLGTGSHDPESVEPLFETLAGILRARRSRHRSDRIETDSLHILLGNPDSQPVLIPYGDGESQESVAAPDSSGGSPRTSWIGSRP